MTWEELVEKHTKENKEHLNGFKQSVDQLEADEVMLLQQFKCSKVADLPDPIQEKLARDKVTWENEWGMYGARFKAMRSAQQREINKYLNQRKIVQDLSKKSNDKSKDKGAER